MIFWYLDLVATSTRLALHPWVAASFNLHLAGEDLPGGGRATDGVEPQESKYQACKVSGPKKRYLEWLLGPESLNIGYLDPLE